METIGGFELGKVHLGDCLELMKRLPDKSIDIVITSPPYNMGGKSLGYQPNSTVGQNYYGEYQDDKDEQEYQSFIINSIRQCSRVSKYTFYNMQYLPTTKGAIGAIMYLWQSQIRDIFIWNKQAVSQIVDGCMATGYEFVFIIGEGVGRKIDLLSGYCPNRQTWYKSETFSEHHATFPTELPEYFIKNCPSANIILDPFSGSGTTGVACAKLGRRFLGFEIDPKYTQLANDRIAATERGVTLAELRQGQQTLFGDNNGK